MIFAAAPLRSPVRRGIRFHQTRRLRRKERGHEVKGPPPEAKRRRLRWGRAEGPRSGSLRVDFFLMPASLQPDLAARREARDRVPQALERHLADDRDRRRVQEVGDLGARDRAADDDPALACPRATASCRARCGRRTSRPRCRTSRSSITSRRSGPPSPPLSVVWPTAATCGSVKITRGESLPSAPCASTWSWPSRWSAARRAWYLPMCVNSALAVDVAERVQPLVAGHADVRVDLDRLAGLEPDDLDADVLRRRLAAERDQQLLARRACCRRPCARSPCRRRPARPCSAFCARADVDAVALAAPR